MSFVPGRDHVQIGDRYVRVLAMTEYASWVDDSTLSRLTNLDTEIILSVSFIPIPTDEAIKFYQESWTLWRQTPCATSRSSWSERKS